MLNDNNYDNNDDDSGGGGDYDDDDDDDFVTETCILLLQNAALWDTGLVHYGVGATGLNWHFNVSMFIQ